MTLAITKEQLAKLPLATFPGRPIVITNPTDCRAALKYLKRQPILGFDTETRPSFHKGQHYRVALLQLSTMEECFLFRLHHTWFTPTMRSLFEDEGIVKVGLSIKDDIHSLSTFGEFEPRNMVELQTFVKDFGVADNSLQKVYGIIFGERISKGQRLTNWEADTLTEQQQAYASLDAYACIRLYRHLTAGNFHPELSPYIVPDPIPEAPAAEGENPQQQP